MADPFRRLAVSPSQLERRFTGLEGDSLVVFFIIFPFLLQSILELRLLTTTNSGCGQFHLSFSTI